MIASQYSWNLFGPKTFQLAQLLLQLSWNDLISCFCLAVGLRMLYAGHCVSYPELFKKLFNSSIDELLPVICYHAVRESMSAYDMLPKEILYLASCDGGYRFCLYPFGEVVNYHYEKLYLPFCQREWTQYVYSPSAERPRRDGLV